MSQSMHDSSSHLVPTEWLATECQQVRGHDSGHTCPAAFGCCCLRSRRRRHHPTSLVSVEVLRYMRFDSHLGAVLRACNYHTRALRHVRKHLTTETAQTIACNIILSRIDYCNSLLYGAPVAVVDKLQRAQINVAWVICQQHRCVRARPLLKSLHCLPVQQCIQYKIVVITHKALSTSVLPYIHKLLQCQVTTRSLRSTNTPRLSVPWTRTETA